MHDFYLDGLAYSYSCGGGRSCVASVDRISKAGKVLELDGETVKAETLTLSSWLEA